MIHSDVLCRMVIHYDRQPIVTVCSLKPLPLQPKGWLQHIIAGIGPGVAVGLRELLRSLGFRNLGFRV